MESLLAWVKIVHGWAGMPDADVPPPVPVETSDLLLSSPPLETATMIATTATIATMTISGPYRLAALGRLPPPLRPCVGSMSFPLGPVARTGDGGLVVAEVGRDHLWVVHHLVGCPGRDHASEVHRDHPVRDRRQQWQVVFDDQQARTQLVADLHHERSERFRFALCDAARRLVEQ